MTEMIRMLRMPRMTRMQTLFSIALASVFVVASLGCDSSRTADRAESASEAESLSGDSGGKTEDSNSETDAASESATQVPVDRNAVNEKNPALSSEENDSDPTIEKRELPATDGDVPFSLKFLSWNVESEGSDPDVIKRQLGEFDGYDVIALTEVLPAAAIDFGNAWGDDYDFIVSRTGNNDRMMLIFNKSTLSLVRKFELADINYKNRYRSPLVAHFKDNLSGKEMLVMVNHLARGSEKTRQIQAEKLVEWARDETLPIVALGDYNFDYVFATRKGNEGFRLFMQDNIWKWIEPIELIDTNWYDNPKEPDGKDDYPGSMLDFGFVAGSAKLWRASCKVIVRDGDFPDDETTSDHRPFELIVSGP